MGSHVDIRQPRNTDDWDELAILIQAYRSVLNRTSREAWSLASDIQGDAHTEVWIADTGTNGVIGFVALHLGRKQSDKHTASVRILVGEEARGQGVATRLLSSALAWADANNVSRVTASPYVRMRPILDGSSYGYDEETAGKVRLFVHYGFQEEGVMRAAARQGDEMWDVALLARVRRA